MGRAGRSFGAIAVAPAPIILNICKTGGIVANHKADKLENKQ